MNSYEFIRLLSYYNAFRNKPSMAVKVVPKAQAKAMKHNASKVKGKNKKVFVISADALPWKF